ncbi:MAG TPA: OmpA family protein [Paracoccus solventivorans]|uniref:OmpA family protein n=1 Tax=Paracoccus solventivorans TaxID=53463 RepID=UPI002B90A110|nr:OmpA family protein [Paracoccus solventivorans]HMM09408.1 OmpA family protein [Paracoccus solventivorans]
MADTDRNATPSPSVRRRRRWRGRLAGLGLLGLAAGAALAAGQWATTRIEDRLAARVRAELAQQSLDWARIAADGLEVRLTGTAPDEIQHLRAVAAASGAAASVTGLSRVSDAVTVASADQPAPPPFRLEILRNEQGTSVIGLAPRAMQRRPLIERLGRAAGPARLTDLLELADHPVPDHWDAAVGFAVAAAEQMPRAKIAVTPGRVEITAVTNGQAEKTRLEQALSLALPAGVVLATHITAPRPVIAPFVLEIARDAEGTRLSRCSADTIPSRDAILAAAAEAGVAGTQGCEVGLGAPSPQWSAAAVAGIEALAALPAGRLTITDTKVVLDAPAQAAEGFAAARDRLAQALPRSFALTATLAPPAPGDPAAGDGPLQLLVSTGPQGVRLQGAVPDERMGAALASLVAARLGPADAAGLAVRGDTPPGWAARGMAAVEALDVLDRGTATGTPALIALDGTTGNPAAAAEIAARLGMRLGAGAAYELALSYDPRLDPASDLPDGQQCVDALNTAMQQAEIGFEPNRAALAGEVGPSIAALAERLEPCSEFRIEVGGHTDSQGSAQFNRKLSADRARAVITALAEAGADIRHLTAVGHGADRPVASNATPEGREANRRIEFRLLSPEPVTTEPPVQITTRGVTVAVAEANGAAAPDRGAEGQDASPEGAGAGGDGTTTDGDAEGQNAGPEGAVADGGEAAEAPSEGGAEDGAAKAASEAAAEDDGADAAAAARDAAGATADAASSTTGDAGDTPNPATAALTPGAAPNGSTPGDSAPEASAADAGEASAANSSQPGTAGASEDAGADGTTSPQDGADAAAETSPTGEAGAPAGAEADGTTSPQDSADAAAPTALAGEAGASEDAGAGGTTPPQDSADAAAPTAPARESGAPASVGADGTASPQEGAAAAPAGTPPRPPPARPSR